MKLYASGDNQGISGVSGLTLREEQRSYQTNFWLMPVASVFGDQVVATTPSRNYTSSTSDTKAFFDAIGFPSGTRQLELVQPLTAALSAPRVNVTHLYGTGVDTGVTYVWEKDGDFDKVPRTVNGPGDGTVNLVALKATEIWAKDKDQAPFTFQSQTFPGQSHTGILEDDSYISLITSFVVE
jgi:hypothetical protein